MDNEDTVEFLGPDPIIVFWDWQQVGKLVPMALCGQHLAGFICTWCPQCVRCRRRMSHDVGHWICIP